MKERPIVFSGESVRAILAGTKTQTRRLLARRLPVDFVGGAGQGDDLSCWGYWVDDVYGRWAVLARGLDQPYAHGCVSIPCPYGVPGDRHRVGGTRLWVRETWWQPPHITTRMLRDGADTWPDVVYDADEDAEGREQWGGCLRWRRRSPIHMPRWASRLTLELTDVRVQRLQEISEEDAKAEGCFQSIDYSARDEFPGKWDALNGKRAPWASNPWVWALSFKVAR